jgi:hypothetical protein
VVVRVVRAVGRPKHVACFRQGLAEWGCELALPVVVGLSLIEGLREPTIQFRAVRKLVEVSNVVALAVTRLGCDRRLGVGDKIDFGGCVVPLVRFVGWLSEGH